MEVLAGAWKMREIKTRVLIIFVLMALFLFFGETCPAFDKAYEKAPEKLKAALKA